MLSLRDIDWELNGVLLLVCFAGVAVVLGLFLLAYAFIMWDFPVAISEFMEIRPYLFRTWIVVSIVMFLWMKITDI